MLAATDRRFEVVPFVLVFVGYLVLHAISNLSNDYFGYRRGHDTDDSPRRRYTLHPVASGAVTMRLLAHRPAGARRSSRRRSPCTSSCCAAGRRVVLAAVGALLLYAYDAAPRALKELGLGEFAAFLVWGPLMIGGGYYVITGQWSGDAFLASVPYGLGVASILIGKHIDQRNFDIGQHQHTLPVLLGERRARLLEPDRRGRDVRLRRWSASCVGALSPFAAVVALVAAPRAMRACG